MARFVTQDVSILQAVQSYRDARGMASECEELKAEAQRKIVGYMNNEGVEVMQAGNSLVKLTRYEQLRVDVTALRKAEPELVKKYTVAEERLRMTINDA